jgi:hypothetical protein
LNRAERATPTASLGERAARRRARRIPKAAHGIAEFGLLGVDRAATGTRRARPRQNLPAPASAAEAAVCDLGIRGKPRVRVAWALRATRACCCRAIRAPWPRCRGSNSSKSCRVAARDGCWREASRRPADQNGIDRSWDPRADRNCPFLFDLQRWKSRYADFVRGVPGGDRVRVGFDAGLAPALFALVDFLLMPSRYEPCGLSQMYAQKFGVQPIAHRTGGLAETIEDGKTGLLFDHADAPSLAAALARAFELHQNPREFSVMRRAAMSLNFDWDRSAPRYVEIYRSLSPRSAAQDG